MKFGSEVKRDSLLSDGGIAIFDRALMEQTMLNQITRGRKVVIWTEDCVRPAHKFANKPPLTGMEALAISRDNQSTMFACGLFENEVVIDFDGADACQNRKALYAENSCRPSVTDKTPSNGYHDFWLVPDGFKINNGASKLGAGIDVVSHKSSPLIWATSYRREKPGKAAGLYSRLAGSTRPGILPASLLELIKASPVPDREKIDPKPYCGDMKRLAQIILDREIDVLAKTAKGGRGWQLWKSASTLGSLVGGGELPEGLVRQRLYDAAVENGLVLPPPQGGDGQKAVKAKISSAIRKARTSPRELDLTWDEKRALEATKAR